jgi:hypothetical protein
MINWPTFQKQPSNESNAVGSAVDAMVSAARAESAANMRQLQQARAAEAKRQRQESLDASKVLTTEFRRD